jgi:3-hydroxymyristoyl/3-hydroxydecanoyl-(acyl carrier protein) dehydratase
MLLLDEVTEIDLVQKCAKGLRHIDKDDPLFAGHFPEEPIYPGAFVVETMGQLGLSLMYFCEHQTITIKAGVAPRRLRLLRIHQASFMAEVLPGDDLTVFAKLIDMNEFTVVGAGQILKGNIICALAIMEVYLVAQ